MKITRLELLHVRPRWLFLKMSTDAGIVGYGEPVVEGRAQTVAAAVRELERYLIGQDPRRIEHHWQAMYRDAFYRGGPVLTSAISGVEQAMWDITGKWLGVPVYQLLGGHVRDRIRVYAHAGGATPEEAARSARARLAEGYRALKTGVPGGPFKIVDTLAKVEHAVACFAAMREAVGPEVDIGIDFHGQIGPAMAVRLAKALEPHYPMFIEEPCQAQNVDVMATIARSTSIPVATGERLFTKWAFREVLEKQAAVILQPDLCHAGGILECKKIAAMAECYYAAIAPHNPLGPISLAAGLQLDACVPNFLCQEQVSLGEGYLKAPFVIEDGYIALPTGPGLGIEPDEEALADKLFEGDWPNPQLRYEDGSVSDW
ncbi:MAG: galactonate dehydratase [Armatimonadetes bacterium]|nr:galactonate dehydratase [Armatimonadota bacterium]